MEEPKELKEKAIRIVWGNDENTPSLYANHLQINFGEGTEFHITFGHLSPPLTFGLEEHELPEEIIVKPTVKIIASPDVMRQFARVFEDSLKKFERIREKQAEREKREEE